MIATALLAACGGFLIAVLWMDLMFDVQVLRTREGDVPEAAGPPRFAEAMVDRRTKA